MFRLAARLKVYLHREPIDFRLNINGLSLLVEQALRLDPFAASESPRLSRRLQLLRRWSHEQVEQVFARGA